MNKVEIHLFGTPTVHWNGKLWTIARRQVRALLFRLAAEMQPVPREHLCLLFWPDRAQMEAHRALSHLLTHLRHALPIAEMVHDADDYILLEPEFVEVDSARFHHLLQQNPHVATVDEIEQATRLYHGPFMDAFALDGSPEYENWVTMARATFERHYQRALTSLADHWAEEGNYATATIYLLHALQDDPLDELLQQRLMLLYLASGNRSAAIRQYERYSHQLKAEMALDPMPETVAIYQHALNNNGHSPSVHSNPRQTTQHAEPLHHFTGMNGVRELDSLLPPYLRRETTYAA